MAPVVDRARKVLGQDEFRPPFSRSAALSFNSEHLLRSENIPFDIDNWYPALRRWTFDTTFLPLSRAEARAIVRYYRTRFLGWGSSLTPADAAVLQRLEDRIDQLVRIQFGSAGCFMRLCGRSAKDAEPLDPGRVRREYGQALRRLGRGAAETSVGVKMRAAMQVSVLRACTGPEVMSMLLSSERVYSDMLDWLWFGEPEQIVLRRWEPDVSQDNEFRLYVHANSLNAISQYDHYCRHDHLLVLRERIQERLVHLWREIHPHVGYDSYAMDVVYLPSSDRLMLVELSPFLRCTGAHCFRWSTPADADVLEGRKPFEFRLVKESLPGFEGVFCTNWEERWYPDRRKDDSRGQLDAPSYWEFYQTAGERRIAELRQHAGSAVARLRSGRSRCRLVGGASRHALFVAWIVLVVPAAILSMYSRWSRTAVVAMAGCAAWVVCTRRRGRRRCGAQPQEAEWTPLFVYGTLKRGMHWNDKFLGRGARFLAPATTRRPLPLVVGRCGVPYLLLDCAGEGHQVRGELWEVDADTLEGLDQYEGVGKRYYGRHSLLVTAGDGRDCEAQTYGMQQSPAELRQLPHLPEYTHEVHKRRYRAVAHIALKQRIYLQGVQQYNRRDACHGRAEVSEDASEALPDLAPRGPWMA